MIKKEDCVKITDEEIALLISDNPNVFECIIERYEKKIHYFVRRISGVSSDEADDIVQDIFIKTYININEFDTSFKFSSWIYRIARNEVISTYRKKKSRPKLFLDDENTAIYLIANDLNLEENVDKMYLSDIMRRSISDIPEKYKEVIILKFFEDKDYKEISDIIKKPIGTVATRINRAKKILKEKLDFYIENHKLN